MTTTEVAQAIIALYNQGKAVEAEELYYADNVVSHEQYEGMPPVVGKAAVIEKTKHAFGSVTEFTKSEASALYAGPSAFPFGLGNVF